MQMFSRRFLQVGVLIFVTTALALSAQAAGFSEANLKGSYSFLINKWTANPNSGQFAMVGVLTFDGAGNVSGSATAVGQGETLSGALGGTYTVNSDGTGVIDFTSLFIGGTAQVAFILNSTIAGVARGAQLLVTDQGGNNVTSGTAVLQFPTAMAYSVASLRGNFAFHLNTWSADPTMSAQGSIGSITFDGAGNLVVSLTAVIGGAPYTSDFTGTYTVNPDGSCTTSWVLSSSGTSEFACAVNTVIAGGARGLQLVLANPTPRGANQSTNYELTGTAVKQSISLYPGQ